MSLAELQTLACNSTGNVVNMETLDTVIELPCPQAAESSGVCITHQGCAAGLYPAVADMDVELQEASSMHRTETQLG